jgi:hypothetical protein
MRCGKAAEERRYFLVFGCASERTNSDFPSVMAHGPQQDLGGAGHKR